MKTWSPLNYCHCTLGGRAGRSSWSGSVVGDSQAEIGDELGANTQGEQEGVGTARRGVGGSTV